MAPAPLNPLHHGHDMLGLDLVHPLVPKDRKDVPLQAAHDVFGIPRVSPCRPRLMPDTGNGLKRGLLRDQQRKLRLPLLVRRVNAGLHLFPSLVPSSARLFKTDLRVRAKEQHFLPGPECSSATARSAARSV